MQYRPFCGKLYISLNILQSVSEDAINIVVKQSMDEIGSQLVGQHL